MKRCERTLIANNEGFGGNFKIYKCDWKDGHTTYDVFAYIGLKTYNYNGFKNMKNAFDKMKKYQQKAMENALR